MSLETGKKIGIALGSGGAKGAAHLGVLKAFEEQGIRFDCVAGTSIGSIVGAAYAAGLSAEETARLVQSVYVRDRTGQIDFWNGLDPRLIATLVEEKLPYQTIESLPVPFRAVACTADTQEKKVFTTGSIGEACAASCAIPPYFRPMRLDRNYIDGAFVDPVPTDEVGAMGADFVIGVDLDGDAQAEADFIIRPDLSDFSAMSLFSLSAMYAIGYRAAHSAMPTILNLLRTL